MPNLPINPWTAFSNVVRKLRHPGTVVLLFIFSFIDAYSQTRTIDSLRQQLVVHQSDTAGIKVCILLAAEFSRSNMQQSREYLYRGIALARQLKTSYGISGCYSQLATSYQNASQPDSALKYLALLKTHSEATAHIDDRINYNMTAGLYYKNQSQFDEAIRYMLKTIEIMDEEKHGATYAGQLLNIGNAYMNTGNLHKAAEYHLLALQRFEKLNNQRGESFCYQSLGNDYLKLKQFRQSLIYFERSRDLKEKLNDTRGLVATWSALGNLYVELGDYQSSLENYKKSLEQARSLKLHRDEVRTLFDMGALYAKMKKPAEARTTFDIALPIALQSGDSLLVARIRSELSKLDIKKNDLFKVVRDLENRVEAASRAGDLNSVAYGYLDLADHYSRQKDFTKAYQYLQLHHQYRDSVAGKEVVMKFQELEQRFEKEKRERQIALLKKDQLLARETLVRQEARQQITAVALVSVLVLSLLGFFYLRLKSKSKRKEDLNEVRNSIARDLHDDIGSALSSINIVSQVALQERGDVRHHLQKISESSSKMMEGMSDIVWSINPENESLEKLVGRMKEFAGEILEPANIYYNIIVSGNVEQLILDPKIRKSIFLVFKEAINNTAKYSEGTEVIIELSAVKNKLTLRVKDNGKGFEADGARSAGNGLHNMSSRATDANGSVKLTSAPGSGTEVLMELPLT